MIHHRLVNDLTITTGTRSLLQIIPTFQDRIIHKSKPIYLPLQLLLAPPPQKQEIEEEEEEVEEEEEGSKCLKLLRRRGKKNWKFPLFFLLLKMKSLWGVTTLFFSSSSSSLVLYITKPRPLSSFFGLWLCFGLVHDSSILPLRRRLLEHVKKELCWRNCTRSSSIVWLKKKTEVWEGKADENTRKRRRKFGVFFFMFVA